ncbi:MAG: hypothetical protein QF790_05900 [Gammaproteobacteria bacterium]|jgi:hypothetical protein|nr:hypothetical protein [Gammaproteobacteria bacterium]MDP6616680.1 hypothetical protein [Gammaproteobacteria bacterium]MDP6696119.1 hypothetical protein [Gammaproteobacteria bacterium]
MKERVDGLPCGLLSAEVLTPAIMVNHHTAFRLDATPFAGLREPGLGIGGIPHTIRDISIEKMMVINLPSP